MNQQLQAQQLQNQQLMQLQLQNQQLMQQQQLPLNSNISPYYQQQQYNPYQQQQQYNPYQQQQYYQQQQGYYGQQQPVQYNSNMQQAYNAQQAGYSAGYGPQQYQQQQYLQQTTQQQQQQQQPYYGQQQQQQQQQVYDPFYSQQRRVFNMKEKWFTLTDTLSIMDENGQPAYKAVGKFFHLGVDMYIKDAYGNTLCELKSKILTLMPEYDFYQNGQIIGKVRKELTLFGGEKWHFTDLKKNQQWELTGDFVNYDWRIHLGNNVCGEITRKHSFIKEHYGIRVEPGADITQVICVAVCMEKYHHDRSLKK